MEYRALFIKFLSILLLSIVIYLNWKIFESNINLEINKSLISKYELNKGSENSKFLSENIRLPDLSDFMPFKNAKEYELILRLKLIMFKYGYSIDSASIKKSYLSLLSIKPTWPYFYSGLLQLHRIDDRSTNEWMLNAINYGPYEANIQKSISEYVFYGWSDLQEESSFNALKYLSNQTNSNISNTVYIASKYGRMNEFCDYLFELTQKENVICLNKFWKPLLKE